MIAYALRRLAITVPVLVVISFGTFWAAGEISSPTAQLTLNPRISPEAKQAYVELLGLDRPLHVQYGKWFANFVSGDFGTSLGAQRPGRLAVRGAGGWPTRCCWWPRR